MEKSDSEARGFVYACIFDGQGGGRQIDFNGVREWRPEEGALWVHLDYTGESARRYIIEESGVEPVYVESLLAEVTRPRVKRVGDALLVILCGVNLNAGADPDEMIAVRAWVEADRVITTRHRRLMAINDLRESLARGEGPRDPGEFLVSLAGTLIARMGPTLENLGDELDALEDQVLSQNKGGPPPSLSTTRHTALTLRRHLAPQREVLGEIHGISMVWLKKNHQQRLGEIADNTARYVEDLNLIRERGAVIQDEANNSATQRMNRSIFVLTIVSTVMLPLALFTGLLGINVAGIPAAEQPWAFGAVLVLMGLIVVCVIGLLRKFKIL